MLENAPENMPRVMPMTAAIAPAFAARYPEAAIIFDNLHGMHDVISDILASPQVPRERKREEILRAAERYRDDTSFVMTAAEWREMAQMMGVQNMGGPVTGFLAGFPQPTVERGAVMAHGGPGGTDHAAMGHGQPAQARGRRAGSCRHGPWPQPVPAQAPPSAQGHAAMGHGNTQGQGAVRGMQHDASPHMALMMEMHERMMADPVIRARVAADSGLQRMMAQMHGEGMDHGAMHGAAAVDSAQALEFVVRLLSDPRGGGAHPLGPAAAPALERPAGAAAPGRAAPQPARARAAQALMTDTDAHSAS